MRSKLVLHHCYSHGIVEFTFLPLSESMLGKKTRKTNSSFGSFSLRMYFSFDLRRPSQPLPMAGFCDLHAKKKSDSMHFQFNELQLLPLMLLMLTPTPKPNWIHFLLLSIFEFYYRNTVKLLVFYYHTFWSMCHENRTWQRFSLFHSLTNTHQWLIWF